MRDWLNGPASRSAENLVTQAVKADPVLQQVAALERSFMLGEITETDLAREIHSLCHP